MPVPLDAASVRSAPAMFEPDAFGPRMVPAPGVADASPEPTTGLPELSIVKSAVAELFSARNRGPDWLAVPRATSAESVAVAATASQAGLL